MNNHKHTIWLRPCITGIILAFICALSATATSASNTVNKTSQVLDIEGLVSLVMQKNFEVLQYQQRQPSEALSLQLANQRFIPKLNISSQYGRDEKALYNAINIDNVTTGLENTASINWLMPTGADISLSYKLSNGKLTGLNSLGVPENTQQNSTTTASIDQPIIGGLWRNLNKLPKERAQIAWQYYQAQGNLLALQSEQIALKSFLDFQEKYDQVELLNQALVYTTFRANAVDERYQAGQTVMAEHLQARLEQHQRQAAVSKAQSELELIQQSIRAQLDTETPLEIRPLSSLRHLFDCINPATNHKALLVQHPLLQLDQFTQHMAKLDYTEATFELWPKVSLFYNYSKSIYEYKQDTDAQSYGIKASYTPFNTAGKLSKQQLRTEWLNAKYDTLAKQQQLQQQYQLSLSTEKSLQSQWELTAQGTSLSYQAFTHAQTRFSYGIDSVLDVKQAQDVWLTQQQDELTALKALLYNRLEQYEATGKLVNYQKCKSFQ